MGALALVLHFGGTFPIPIPKLRLHDNKGKTSQKGKNLQTDIKKLLGVSILPCAIENRKKEGF